MKKLITGILATLAVCSCFAGCDLLGGKKKNSTSSSPDPEPTPAEANVEGAADYLEAMYNDHEAEGRADYERITSLLWPAIDGHTYKVEWSVNVDADFVEIEAIDGEDKVLVNVDEQSEVDKDYVLTAKVSYEDKSATTSFNYKLVKGPDEVPSVLVSAPTVDQNYKLYMYQPTKKSDEFFIGKLTSNGFYLDTWYTADDAADVKVTASSKSGHYNLSFVDEANKTQYIGIKNTYNNGSWHDNVFLSETLTDDSGDVYSFDFAYNAEYNVLTATLVGVKEGEVEDVATSTTETFYLGTNKSYYTFGAMNLDTIEAADSAIGRLVLMLTKADFDEAERIAEEKTSTVETIKKSFTGATTYKLPKRGQLFSNVKIAWAVKEGNATVNGNVLTLAAPTTDTSVTLTATITCGTAEAVVQDVVVNHYRDLSAEQILTEAYALEADKWMSSAQTLTGTITQITSAYSSQHGNVSFEMVVDGFADMPIIAFYAVGNDASTVKVGDVVTVNGFITNYKGTTVEFSKYQEQSPAIKTATTPDSVSDTAKAGIERASLKVGSVVGPTEVTLPVVGATYDNVAISWASDNAIAVVNGNKLTVSHPEVDTDVKLTATLTIGSVTATKVITMKVLANPGFVSSSLGLANAAVFTSYTSGNVTFTATKGEGSTDPAYYTSGTALRLYGKNTFTISVASGYKITSITIKASSNQISGSNCTITNGTATGLGTSEVVITPTDSTAAVVLTNSKSSGNFRIAEISVVCAAVA